jgi:Rhodopirellula transposase DDE domain
MRDGFRRRHVGIFLPWNTNVWVEAARSTCRRYLVAAVGRLRRGQKSCRAVRYWTTADNGKPVAVEKKELSEPDLVNRLLSLIGSHTAGSAVDPAIKWTHLKPREIAVLYQTTYRGRISNGTVKRILKAEGYRKRRPSKQLSTGKSPFRAEQFKVLIFLTGLFALMDHNPTLSMDTKKKERLGRLDRGGTLWCQTAPKVFDHDYPYLAEGKIIPHGIFDIRQNKGFVSIGNSHETAAFVVDNLRWWWYEYGIHHYPNANFILLLCDSGGANGYRHHAFKKELLDLANEIQIKIVVCHYPPYCSKWNPIEHRLFSQIHHAINGQLFINYQQVKELFEKTTTQTGLTIVVRLNLGEYDIGLKIQKKCLPSDRILKHPLLPQFNYTLVP